MFQFLEMKGQGRLRRAELFAQRTGVQALRPGLYQAAKDAQARFLGECGQSQGGGCVIHISMIIEI